MQQTYAYVQGMEIYANYRCIYMQSAYICMHCILIFAYLFSCIYSHMQMRSPNDNLCLMQRCNGLDNNANSYCIQLNSQLNLRLNGFECCFHELNKPILAYFSENLFDFDGYKPT